MTADFAPLVAYLDKRFDSMDREMSELKEGFSSLQGSVDGFARRADAYFQDSKKWSFWHTALNVMSGGSKRSQNTSG